MRLLFIYHQKPRKQRKAISSHLLAFKKMDDADIYYWNVAYGIPDLVSKCEFDAVLFHFTFFLPNINQDFSSSFYQWKILKNLDIPKFAMIQDEYVNTNSLCKFLKEFGVKHVYTCLPEDLWQVVYPFEKSGVTSFTQVLTGYIDEEMFSIFGSEIRAHRYRRVDIAYRARKMPYNLGMHATYKWMLTQKIQEAHPALKLDLSNDPNDFIFGEEWYHFVKNTRVMPGCEGGTSMLDPDGSIRRKVNNYMLTHPNAEFGEVESQCFPGMDMKFPYYALSPRHFEAAIAKTCQILIEGDYNGVFVAHQHYIPIRKDWSNLQEVLEKCKDIDYCESIAENAYREIALNPLYTYSSFVNQVGAAIRSKIKSSTILSGQASSHLKKLQYYSEHPFWIAPKMVIRNQSVEWLKQIIFITGMDKHKWFRRLELKLFGSNSTR